MLFDLSKDPSIANYFIAELRDHAVQQDKMRFRRNLERLGEVMAFKISQTFDYQKVEIETPLGIAVVDLPQNQIVLATILRAGLPLHNGFLNYFDRAENAFISAYRKHHKDGTFEIKLEYVSCPNLEGKTVIVTDPLLATGASLVVSVKELLEHGKPESIHIATAISASSGIKHVQRNLPQVHIWTGAIDDELTAKSYIVPGLGDAGDLAFGAKMQD